MHRGSGCVTLFYKFRHRQDQLFRLHSFCVWRGGAHFCVHTPLKNIYSRKRESDVLSTHFLARAVTNSERETRENLCFIAIGREPCFLNLCFPWLSLLTFLVRLILSVFTAAGTSYIHDGKLFLSHTFIMQTFCREDIIYSTFTSELYLMWGELHLYRTAVLNESETNSLWCSFWSDFITHANQFWLLAKLSNGDLCNASDRLLRAVAHVAYSAPASCSASN